VGVNTENRDITDGVINGDSCIACCSYDSSFCPFMVGWKKIVFPFVHFFVAYPLRWCMLNRG